MQMALVASSLESIDAGAERLEWILGRQSRVAIGSTDRRMEHSPMSEAHEKQ
jgi:hypothetical protein